MCVGGRNCVSVCGFTPSLTACVSADDVTEKERFMHAGSGDGEVGGAATRPALKCQLHSALSKNRPGSLARHIFNVN